MDTDVRRRFEEMEARQANMEARSRTKTQIVAAGFGVCLGMIAIGIRSQNKVNDALTNYFQTLTRRM